MRPVTTNRPMGVTDAAWRAWVEAALAEIERASHEGDPGEVSDAYDYSGVLTESRTVNLSAPTAANVAAVLATLLSDLQKRGVKHE